MNRKFILLLSLLIIAIGITGILMGSEDDKKILNKLTTTSNEKKVTIVLAQATSDLLPGTLLSHTDYAVEKIKVPESSELIKNDISEVSNINSYLLKTNILSGSYITRDMLVSPESDEFNHLSLQKGEVIYKFHIKQKDDYLLDTLSIGNMLALQLITLETDKNKGMEHGTAINTKEINDRKKQSYSLNKIIPNMKVVRIKKYSSSELSEKNTKNQKTEDTLVGYISVIIKTEDIEIIHIAEKSGDVLLTLTDNNNDDKSTSINLYDIIPKLRTTRELRG
ncbi:tight adherance operon protein [Yersinia artesiana]|uniref:tight adherance operon protein n=1 Tax=Yersinia artesiana TaxID=2890315 RepID=UPI0015839889|nr:tight adherance operon protein [Yersinia artesiana]